MNSFRKLINSRINKEELIKKPEINNALENDKKVRLDFLSSVKPTIIDTKGFKNEKKKTMVEDMNVFKQIYYKDYMINKHSLEKINKISNENSRFLFHFSGFNKYYNNEYQKEILNDIQLEYKKKVGFAPTIKETGNLFSNSILLQNDRELKQYISLDMDTINKDVNSLFFLKNVQNKIKFTDSKKRNNTLEKIGNKEILNLMDSENLNSERKHTKRLISSKIDKNIKENINELKRDIKKTKECMNSIDDLNYFLNLNKPLNLKSRKNSEEASTRMNSGIQKINNKLKIKNDFNNLKINNNYYYKIKKENINNIDRNSNNNNKNNNSSIVLPYIKTNNSLRTEASDVTYNYRERKKTVDFIKITEPIKRDINIKRNDRIKNIKTCNHIKLGEKYRLALRKQPSLEKLYEKISRTENFICYNQEIKNYLKKNNYKVKDKIDTDDLYKSVDQSRRKIIDVSSVQKNYDLMVNNKLKTLQQNKEVIQHNKKIKKNIEDIQERMIGLLCDVNKFEDE